MWSGGKDSLLALLRARQRGLNVATLVSFHDAAMRRLRFHATSAALIETQAASLGIALRAHATSWSGYETALRVILAGLAREGYTGLIFGDIHLGDVRAWYEERVVAAGLTHIEPIWGDPSESLVDELVTSGHRAVITCCEEGKLDRSWLGRVIDATFLRDVTRLPIDAAGENGEYHSFVFDGPAFAQPVRWTRGRETRDGRFLQVELDVA
jgi:uncharacterized protein (TIGR00290 family)